VVLQSFVDRVEVFVVSVPLSLSLGRIQPLSGIKLVTRCSKQVIFVLLIYCSEDRATLIPIRIDTLSTGIKAFVVVVGLTIIHISTFSLSTVCYCFVHHQ